MLAFLESDAIALLPELPGPAAQIQGCFVEVGSNEAPPDFPLQFRQIMLAVMIEFSILEDSRVRSIVESSLSEIGLGVL